MHMSDALISPAVGGAMLAVSAGIIGYSVRAIRKDFKESRIPLMGVSGAFVFAAQMINFAIPGTGSSGHIAGAVLLAALLGPAPAFIVMAGVLLIQAVLFADGGLLAYGCNLFNMGFFGCFLSYSSVFRPIAGKDGKPGRIFAAGIAASMAALLCGAFAVTIETLVSGITELPFGVFAAAMMPIHAAIAIGEGLATSFVLLFVRKNLPDFESVKQEAKRFSAAGMVWTFSLAALVLGGGFSLLASGKPDGLEWSIEHTAGTEIENGSAVHGFFASLSDKLALLPDYVIPGKNEQTGTIFCGIAGAILCAALICLCVGIIRFRKQKQEICHAGK